MRVCDGSDRQVALLWAGLLPVREGEAGTLVVPRHRADPPDLWRSASSRVSVS